MSRLYLADVVQVFFYCYTILLFIRIVISWFPAWHRHHFVRFLSFLTDPYLNIFRRILPPLGGVLDISPLLAFFVLRLLEMILLQLILR
jgi:YggT family protein